jgi:dehydrodolichyl diphosphate syntase complex subunit NUS1
MTLILKFLLSLLHIFRSVSSIFYRFHSFWHLRISQPKDLKAARRKLPDHLALALVTRHDEAKFKKDVVIQRNEVDAAIECVRRVVGWCQVVGINTLTVYDSGGILKTHHTTISAILSSSEGLTDGLTSRPASPFEKSSIFPLTPPASDHSSAASNAGDQDTDSGVITIRASSEDYVAASLCEPPTKRRVGAESRSDNYTSFKLNIVSYTDGKPSLARVARSFVNTITRSNSTGHVPIKIGIEEVNDVLESELPSPALLILHQLHPTISPKPLELYAFPPWQLRLTELYYKPALKPLTSLFTCKANLNIIDERTFRDALDDFDRAEMREGK